MLLIPGQKILTLTTSVKLLEGVCLIPLYIHYYCSYYYCICVPWHTGSSWRTVCRSRFSSSTTWVSGMGLGVSGLVASAFPCWVISQSFTQHFWPQIHGRIFPRTSHFFSTHRFRCPFNQFWHCLRVASDRSYRLVSVPLQVAAHTSDQSGFLHYSSWHGEFPEWLTEH